MLFNPLTGVILISLALCADGAIGNFQEKVLKQYGAANSEIVSLLTVRILSFRTDMPGQTVQTQIRLLLYCS